MFGSTESLFEMLPVAGGLFGVALLLFGFLVFALVAGAVVVYLFRRKAATPATVDAINVADGIDADELARIKKILDDQTEREKDAATREKLLTAMNAGETVPTKKR